MNRVQASLLLVSREAMDTGESGVLLVVERLSQISCSLDETPRFAPDAKPTSKFHFFWSCFPSWISVALFMNTKVLISGSDRRDLLFPVRASLKVSLGDKEKDEIKYSKQFG